MLYLIGGYARTGKSTLARLLIAARPMQWTSTDLIQSVLQDAAPSLGVEVDPPAAMKIEPFQPFLEALSIHQAKGIADSVIEGDVIFPEHVAMLQERGYPVRSCFLGVSTVDTDTLMRTQAPDSWLLQRNQKEQEAFIATMVVASSDIQSRCKAVSLPYIDMAAGTFDSQKLVALKLLLSHQSDEELLATTMNGYQDRVTSPMHLQV